ncbi:TRAP transporter small permease subunit, partial [Bacillus cereus group sp. Bce037]
VDALVKTFSPSLQKTVTLIALALAMVYCVLFFYGSWVYLSKMKLIAIEMEDIPIEKWKAMLCLLIGFALLGLRMITVAIEVI